MSIAEADIDVRIAARIRELRAERGLTLDGLAEAADVSRAMLSRIERGESSPTAHLLGKICNGLGVTLSALLHAFSLRERSGVSCAPPGDDPALARPPA